MEERYCQTMTNDNRACPRADKELFMKKTIFILTVFAMFTFSGCAAVCNPQGASTAIQTGGATGLVLGGAQFTVCLGYNLAKNAMADKSQTSVAVANAVKPVDGPAATPAVDATPAGN